MMFSKLRYLIGCLFLKLPFIKTNKVQTYQYQYTLLNSSPSIEHPDIHSPNPVQNIDFQDLATPLKVKKLYFNDSKLRISSKRNIDKKSLSIQNADVLSKSVSVKVLSKEILYMTRLKLKSIKMIDTADVKSSSINCTLATLKNKILKAFIFPNVHYKHIGKEHVSKMILTKSPVNIKFFSPDKLSKILTYVAKQTSIAPANIQLHGLFTNVEPDLYSNVRYDSKENILKYLLNTVISYKNTISYYLLVGNNSTNGEELRIFIPTQHI